MSTLKQAAEIAARAFFTDPLFSWLFPYESERESMLRAVMGAMLAMRAKGGINVTPSGPNAAGAIAFERPGEQATRMAELAAFAPKLSGIVGSSLRVAHPSEQWRRILVGLRTLEAVHRRRPSESHYYVAVLTVDPSAQRTGLGRELLSNLLAQADAAMVSTHLETARHANLAYYQSFGFQLGQEVCIADAPPVWTLTRPSARRTSEA